jgi:hypothetical protein
MWAQNFRIVETAIIFWNGSYAIPLLTKNFKGSQSIPLQAIF